MDGFSLEQRQRAMHTIIKNMMDTCEYLVDKTYQLGHELADDDDDLVADIET
jgi:hypothetical protein